MTTPKFKSVYIPPGELLTARTKELTSKVQLLADRGADCLFDANEEADAAVITMHAEWRAIRRPFVNVYPKLLDALLRTSLDLTWEQVPRGRLHDFPVIEVRTPESCSLTPYLISLTGLRNDAGESFTGFSTCGLTMYAEDFEGNNQITYTLPSHKNFEEHAKNTGMTGELASEESELTATQMLRLAIGLSLLCIDDTYLDTVLLRKDRNRQLTPEQLEKAKARAAKRGVVGFDLGVKIEQSPHIRRPHFGIRYKRIKPSPEPLEPRLVPVKGCVVHKELVGNVPSGYHGVDEDKHTGA